jgi:hypothetical protein
MTTIISRLYAAEEHAVAAVDALKLKFRDEHINLVTPTSSQDANIEDLAVKGGVSSSDAAVYADKVREGHSLVTVHAPWGFAKHAIKTLDTHGPVASGVRNPDYHYVPGWNEAAPFSAFFGQSVLAKSKSSFKLLDDPTPLSSIFKLATLLNSKSGLALWDKATPFSSLLGLPTISHAKPFSALADNDKSGATLL